MGDEKARDKMNEETVNIESKRVDWKIYRRERERERLDMGWLFPVRGRRHASLSSDIAIMHV